MEYLEILNPQRESRVPTRQEAEIYFGRGNMVVYEYEESFFLLRRPYRVEIIVGGRFVSSVLELWAYDRTHGGGFWHRIS